MRTRYFKVIYNNPAHDEPSWWEIYKVTPRQVPRYYDKYHRISGGWVMSMKFRDNKHLYEKMAEQIKNPKNHTWTELKEEDLFLELL